MTSYIAKLTPIYGGGRGRRSKPKKGAGDNSEPDVDHEDVDTLSKELNEPIDHKPAQSSLFTAIQADHNLQLQPQPHSTTPDSNAPNEITMVRDADQAEIMNIVINQSASGSVTGSAKGKKPGKKGRKG